MVFTPPPSPLPPRHSAFPEPSPTEDQKNVQPPEPKNRRIYLVLLVPLLLVFIGTFSQLVTHFETKAWLSLPTASFSGTFHHDLYADSSWRPPRFSLNLSHRIRSNPPQPSLRERHHRHAHIPENTDLVVRSPDAIDLTGGIIPVLGSPTTPPSAWAGLQTAPPIPTPALPVPTPFPQPWDSSLSYNFSSSSCLAFFSAQLANETFRACRPFGLLLGTSLAFFNIETNLTTLTATIEGTCNAPESADTCNGIMDWMAVTISQPSVCGIDIAARNAIALEALNGFNSYAMMRQAGCAVNPITNAYCFAEAIAEISPADVYYYSLPLGTSIPPSTVPSCSACIKTVLDIYVQYATNTTLPISRTYPSASTKANAQCGANYSQILNVSTAVSNTSSAAGRRYIVPLAIALGYDTGGPLLVITLAVSISFASFLSL